MTKAIIVEGKIPGYLKKFRVDIDLSDISDAGINDIISDLKNMDWNFADDLVGIIKEGK